MFGAEQLLSSQNLDCWAKVEMAYPSLHVLICNCFSQKLTSWVFNDQPCECADVGHSRKIGRAAKMGWEKIWYPAIVAGHYRRSGATDPILSAQRIPRGRDPVFIYTNFFGAFLVRNCWEKWLIYNVYWKYFRAARAYFLRWYRSLQEKTLYIKTFYRCAGWKVQKFLKKKAYALKTNSRCAGWKVKTFCKRRLIHWKNIFPLRGLKS